MGYADSQLNRRKRRGNRGVDVTHNQNHLRLVIEEYGFDALHHFRSLYSMTPGTNLEIHIRFRNPEICEEVAGKKFVVVLAGMDQAMLDIAILIELLDERRDLHEVRARPDDT